MTTTDSNAADPNALDGGCCGSCSSTDTPTAQQSEESTTMETTTYTVTGMTCGHCVSAVSTEIGRLTGVSDVQVDLSSGAVSVTSATRLPHEEVVAAVEEAGYELAATGASTGDGVGTGPEGGRAG